MGSISFSLSLSILPGHAVMEVRTLHRKGGRVEHLVRDASNNFEFYDAVVFACSVCLVS